MNYFDQPMFNGIAMKFRKVWFLWGFLTLISISQAFAQINYGDIRVDELTDTQIRQLIQRAESIGFNDAQLEQMAAAQGMKAAEITKLRTRVEKIRKEDAEKGRPSVNPNNQTLNRSRSYNESGRDSLRKEGNKTPGTETPLFDVNTLFEGLKPKIFGATLFQNNQITFEPDLKMPTPKGYIIGPEDELLIDITGDNEKEYQLKVSPDGTIRMEYVGLIAVGGLTIEAAGNKIKNAMTPTYPAMRSGRTKVSINLGNIRSIKVILTGEIVKPGTYTLPSLATVFNALYASGGPNENGSFRNIQVIRNGTVVRVIDAYEFLLNGLQKGNIRLQDQDVIHVPVYQTRVEVSGEVKRPALYELLPAESLKEALTYAGGFGNQAYQSRIKVLQNTDKERRIVDVTADEFGNYRPKNGDKYMVEAILERFENRVEIEGAVFRPGQYQLEKGLTLKGLIQKAEGLTEDAYLYRGNISRLNPDNTLALIPFDVAKIMNGSAADLPLRREDKVVISSIFDLRDEYEVTIQGDVRTPGTFPFARPMYLGDLIQLAGGFKEGATPENIEISRRVKNSDANSRSARTAEIFMVNLDKNLKLSDQEFKLEPYDIVSIRSAEGYTVQRQVKLEGEVLYPGPYTINRKDERISDIIKRAGGLTSGAYPDGASLKRAGASKVNPNAKNAINDAEEEERNLLNLQRLKQTTAKDKNNILDSIDLAFSQKVAQSDLIGIDLVSILDKPGANYDLILEDGDIIRIPKLLQTVKVTGEVLNPNGIVFKPGRSLKSYVNGAGGFTANALKRNVFVKYANGTAEAATKFLFFNNYPRIKPGAEIMVPKRAEREPMTTQGWIAISTALASMAAIVITLFR